MRVVDHRNVFLNEMASLGFLQSTNAPNDECAEAVKDLPLTTKTRFTTRAHSTLTMTNVEG